MMKTIQPARCLGFSGLGRTISGKGEGRAGAGRRAGKALLEDRMRSYRLFGSRSR
jgi:hypothetical protein